MSANAQFCNSRLQSEPEPSLSHCCLWMWARRAGILI